MHVIVVGGGVAGLSLYLQLRRLLNQEHTITVFESHNYQKDKHNESPSTFGGGLGIAPNGMKVLKTLDPLIYKAVKQVGYTIYDFEFQTAGGYLLGRWPASSRTDPKEGTVMIERKALWSILRNQIPNEVIRTGVNVVEVHTDGTVVTSTGEKLKADFVVGADGVRSVTRQCVIDEGESGRNPEFQDLMNVGGSLPESYLAAYRPSTSRSGVMTFGPEGFVGYTLKASKTEAASQNTKTEDYAMWWSTYSDTPTDDQRRTTSLPPDPQLKLAVEKRHGSWKDPVIQAITTDLAQEVKSPSGTSDRTRASLDLLTPTWILRKLPRWYRGRVLLAGDAAHALPSTSGQGISQALEDSYVLAFVLKELEESRQTTNGELDEETIEEALENYEKIRKPRADRVLETALRMQNSKRRMSTFELYFTYFILWAFIKFGFGRQESWKYDYNVVEDLEDLYDNEGIEDHH